MLGSYVVGLVLCVAAVGPIGLAAFRLRARALPGLSGAPARVAEVILVAGLLVVALELVGVLGAFDRVGAVIACVAVGLAGMAVAGALGPAEKPWRSSTAPVGTAPVGTAPVGTGLAGTAPAGTGPAVRGSVTPRVAAIVATAVVSASWLGWTLFSYHHGMETVDTLWYHLPTAARFVQTGSILHLQYFDSQPVTVFYPANAELFHAFGLLLFGSDVASPAINLGWAALALAAAWAIGGRYDRGPHCLVAVALVLATPALIDTQPGGAYNDIVCIALLLSSVAMLVVSDRPRLANSALAAIAAGLALGTKFTMIAPVLALGLGAVVIAAPGVRSRHAGVWVAGLLVVGGYWYVRNAVLVGNPLPSLAIGLGPLTLPAPVVRTPTFTVAQYLTNPHIWGSFYVPGFRRALGPAWWAIIGLGCIGPLGAIVQGDRLLRMLGTVTAVSIAAFIFTPQFLGLPGAPIFFVYNVRYVEAALALGLVLLPIQSAFAAPRRANALLLAAGAVLLATELDPGVWRTGIGLTPFATPLSGGSAIAGALLGAGLLAVGLVWLVADRRGWTWSAAGRHGWSWEAWRGRRVAAALGLGAGLGIVVLGGWALSDTYAAGRYQDSSPLPRIYRWARTISHTRIGIVGFTQQYPLYGQHDSNYVQYIGAGAPHRGFGPITSCPAWRRAVNRGRYRWLVIAPAGFPFGASAGPEVVWTSASGVATTVIREHSNTGPNEQIVVLRVNGTLNPRTCPGSAGTAARLSSG